MCGDGQACPTIPSSLVRSSTTSATLFGRPHLLPPAPATDHIQPSAMDQKRDENHVEEPKRFEPKKPVQLDPPKDDPITVDYLAKCDGAIHRAVFFL